MSDPLAISKPNKTRWRFTLRAGFVLLTVLCLLLGWLIEELQKFHRELLCHERLKTRGFHLLIQGTDTSNPFAAISWLDLVNQRYSARCLEASISKARLTKEDMAGLSQLPYLVRLQLDGCMLPEGSFKEIGHLSNLNKLWLTDVALSRNDVEPLADLESLQEVTLVNCEIDDDHCEPISRCSGLLRLSITDSSITSDSFRHLKRLSNLQHLDLSNTNVTDAGLNELSDLTELKELDLSSTNITDRAVDDLVRFQGLSSLDLSQTKLTDMGVFKLNSLRHLRSLVISESGVTDATIVRLQQQLQELSVWVYRKSFDYRTSDYRPSTRQLRYTTELDFQCVNVGDSTLEWLQNAPQLEILRMSKVAITDQGLQKLRQNHGLANLQMLDLRETAISDEGLKAIADLPSLISLSVENISDAGIARIATAKSLQVLWLSGDRITDEGLFQLRALPQLDDLTLTTPNARGLRFLSEIPHVNRLCLRNMRLSREGALAIEQESKLAAINLFDVQFDPDVWQVLKSWSRIKRLAIFLTQPIDQPLISELIGVRTLKDVGFPSDISDDLVDRLRTARPDVNIWFGNARGSYAQTRSESTPLSTDSK